MGHSVKHLLHKHKDLSSDPQHEPKSQACMYLQCQCKEKTGGTYDLLTSQSSQLYVHEDPVSKINKVRWKMIEEDT